MVFCDGHHSLNIMFPDRCMCQTFIPLYFQLIFPYLDVPCFIYPLSIFISSWTSSSFYFLAIAKNALIDCCAQVFVWVNVFI